jgi:hypothetical protein
MPVRPLVAMHLWLLGAVTAGCGTSAGPQVGAVTPAAERSAPAERVAPGERAAEKKAAQQNGDQKKADQDKAAAHGYVKIMVEVELRGVLSSTEQAAIISIGKEDKWVLDFDEDNDIRAKAKGLNGKTVLVKGSAILRRIITRGAGRRQMDLGDGPSLESFVDLEPKVAVKSLVAATKE